MKYILYDFDNTFGIENCDLDDGIALLYLLGREKLVGDIKVVGVTTTFGNGSLEEVKASTDRLLALLGRTDIPVFHGRERSNKKIPIETLNYEEKNEKPCEYNLLMGRNSAAEAIIEMSKLYGDDFYVLATGSMTNVGEAAKLAFANGIKPWNKIVIMGGITETLVFKKAVMDELNISCNYNESFNLFKYGNDISVLSANNCLSVYHSLSDYEDSNIMKFSKGNLSSVNRELQKTAREYYGYNKGVYGIEGFIHWDLLAAQYLTEPSLFEDNLFLFNSSHEDLKRGFLRIDPVDIKLKSDYLPCRCEGKIINLPKVVSSEAVRNDSFKYIFSN